MYKTKHIDLSSQQVKIFIENIGHQMYILTNQGILQTYILATKVIFNNIKFNDMEVLLPHCAALQTEDGVYIKDLRVIRNKSLKDIVIVDNAVYSFGF